MSQSIYFARIKCFSEEFTDQIDYPQVLNHLKNMLRDQEEEEVDRILSKIFIESIEVKCLDLSAYLEKIQKFLESGSKAQLHPKSRHYFVTTELWAVLKESVFNAYQSIEEAEEWFDIAKDFADIESIYTKKMLVFEVS